MEAVWMYHWQEWKVRGKKRKGGGKTCELGGQSRVSLSILPQGEEKAKNTLQLFSTREALKRNENMWETREKIRAFPSSPTPSPCLRLFFPSLDFFSSVFLHKNESRQLCYPCRLLHIVWLGRGIEILPVFEKHKSAIASRREKVIKLLMRSKKHPETEYERRRL